MAVLYTATVGTTDYGFDWEDQEIEVEAGVTSVTATDLKTAIKEAEHSEIGIIFPDIGTFGNPVTLDATDNVETALNVILLEAWVIQSLSVSGSLTVGGGNVVNQALGGLIFATNNSVQFVNRLSAAATFVGSPFNETDRSCLLLVKRILANEADITVGVGDSRTIEIYDEGGRSGGTVIATFDVDSTGLLRSIVP